MTGDPGGAGRSGPADTAWMSQPCRSSCMNRTSTSYDLVPAAPERLESLARGRPSARPCARPCGRILRALLGSARCPRFDQVLLQRPVGSQPVSEPCQRTEDAPLNGQRQSRDIRLTDLEEQGKLKGIPRYAAADGFPVAREPVGDPDLLFEPTRGTYGGEERNRPVRVVGEPVPRPDGRMGGFARPEHQPFAITVNRQAPVDHLELFRIGEV